MQCTYYRGSNYCQRPALKLTETGAPTCGQHERGGLGRRDRQLALDVLEVAHVLGVGQVSFEDWLRIFFQGHPARGGVRAFERWKARMRRLGLAAGRQSLTGVTSGSMRFREFSFDLPRAVQWAQQELGEEVRAPLRQRYGYNVPTADEVFSDRGSRAMSDWRTILPLEPVSSQVLQVLADQQTAMTVQQLTAEVRHGNRGHVVVGAHRAKRPPCRLCAGDHSLRQHHHKIDGPRRTVYAPVKNMAAAVRRSLAELVSLGFVERRGRAVAITNPGYEAAIAERAIRAEASVAGYDPERDYEAALTRRASRAPEPDLSFDFGQNLIGANPYGSLALVGLGNPTCGCGCNGAGACMNPYGSLALVGLGNPGPADPSPIDNGFVGEISVAEAGRHATGSERRDYEKSQRDTKRFHGTGPARYAVYRVPDGKKGVTREYASALGRVPQSRYLGGLGPQSNKNKAELWIHEHEKGSEPLEIKYARTGLTGKVGGAFFVDEWMEK